MSTGPHHPKAVDNRHTKRPPPAGEQGSLNSASAGTDPTGSDSAPNRNQDPPHEPTTPNEATNPSDEPSWHQLLGTLLSSQRTDAHPPLTLAGSWPEARFQSTRVSGPFRSRFRGFPFLHSIRASGSLSRFRFGVPPLYQSFWSALPVCFPGSAFLNSTRAFVPLCRCQFRRGEPPAPVPARPSGRRGACRSC
jgi:hypothetical protein